MISGAGDKKSTSQKALSGKIKPISYKYFTTILGEIGNRKGFESNRFKQNRNFQGSEELEALFKHIKKMKLLFDKTLGLLKTS